MEPLRAPIVVLAVVTAVAGCGTSRTTVVHDPGAGGTGPLSRQVAERYGETLAEPVAVVAADDEGATWSVLFGTNRTADDRTGEAPVYGECRVALPRSPRGSLVLSEPRRPLGGILPASWSKPKTTPVEVGVPDRLAADFFHQRLRDRVERSPQRDVLLFVHGFNVPFRAAIARAAQLGSDVPFNGAIVAYSWPSRGATTAYGRDETIVADSVPAFRRFVTDLRRELPTDARLHVVVHSMGNRLVLRSLAGIAAPPEGGEKPFANVVLAAPDVGVTEFPALARHLVRLADRVTLYACDTDVALTASKGLHAEQRIGDDRPPVIVPGVETIDASSLDTSLLGHSYYGDNAGVLADLFCLLKEDRPATDRDGLRPVPHPDGTTHWVFDREPPTVHWVWRLDDLEPEP